MPVLQAERIVSVLRGAFAKESPAEKLLQIAAEKIHAVGAPYAGARARLLTGDALVHEATAGDVTAVTLEIPLRRGREVLGQLDVASTGQAPLADDELAEVHKVAEALAVLL